MRKRMICGLLIIAVLLVTVPAYAVTPRAPRIRPGLTFSGTQANCALTVTGDSTTDEISATIRLKNGTRTLATWTVSDTGTLYFSDTATVSRNRTYTLTADVQINGVTHETVSVSETNN